jgi:hypothetical protein
VFCVIFSRGNRQAGQSYKPNGCAKTQGYPRVPALKKRTGLPTIFYLVSHHFHRDSIVNEEPWMDEVIFRQFDERTRFSG